MNDGYDEGGDPACWSHLQTTPTEPPADGVLARLMDELADAVIICDADGRITFWNDAATRVFGWTPQEAFGESLDIIVPERFRKRHWDGYFRAIRTGTTSYRDRLLEVPAVHREGHVISIAFTVSLIPVDGSDRPAGIAAVVRDETGRRSELQELRRRAADGHD